MVADRVVMAEYTDGVNNVPHVGSGEDAAKRGMRAMEKTGHAPRVRATLCLLE